MCWLGNPVRDTFNVPYDLFPTPLIKLLITFGCYGHWGDIPQVLSAAWAQRLGHIPFSLFVSQSHLQPALCSKYQLYPRRAYRIVYAGLSKCYFAVRRLLCEQIAGHKWFLSLHPTVLPPLQQFPLVGPPLWLHCRGFCSPSSCLEMRTRHGPLHAFTRYCYVSEPIN